MHYCHLSHSVRDASLQLPYRNYREGMQEKKNAQGWLWRWASGISPTGSEHKKRAEKQDKKNFYLLSSSPIIRTRYLKNVNGGTICLFAAHVTQSMTEQEVSQIRSTQLEQKKKKMLFPNYSDDKREKFERLCCLTTLCLALVKSQRLFYESEKTKTTIAKFFQGHRVKSRITFNSVDETGLRNEWITCKSLCCWWCHDPNLPARLLPR